MQPARRRKRLRFFAILIAVTLLGFLLSVTNGSAQLELASVMNANSTDFQIFWNLRVSRTLVAFLAGSGLAACGLTFQAMFLNPLATPFTLGVSSGASFGATFLIWMGGLPGLFEAPSLALGALVGAGLAVGLVIVFGRTRAGHQKHTMLLAGVAVSFFFSSLILLFQSLASYSESFRIVHWLMGAIAVAGYREVGLMLPVIVIGFGVLWAHCPHLNLLILGEELAHTRGVAVQKTRRTLFLVVSVMVAVIVSVTGPIGFVGMVVPHICRLILGNYHRVLVPASILLGGCALVYCDLVSRLLFAPSELPVGVITSIAGAPFFFFLLLRRQMRL